MDGKKEILLISVGAIGEENGEVSVQDSVDLLDTIWAWLESTEEDIYGTDKEQEGQGKAHQPSPHAKGTAEQGIGLVDG